MSLTDEVRGGANLPPPADRRRIRLEAGVTQTRMATELGVARSTFIWWETGAHQPDPANRARYATLLRDLARASAAPAEETRA